MKDSDKEEGTKNSVSLGDLSVLFKVGENRVFGELRNIEKKV